MMCLSPGGLPLLGLHPLTTLTFLSPLQEPI